MATLYVTEQGSEIGCDGERLAVRRDNAIIASIPLIKIEDIVIIGNVGLSTPAIKRMLDNGINVTFLTVHGRYQGRLVGSVSAHAALRAAQYRRADDRAWSLRLAQRFVEGKLRNCRALLRRFARNRADAPAEAGQAADDLDRFIDRVPRTTTLNALMGVEGSATARYFAGVRALIGAEWRFEARIRRPPPDRVNALLSFGYTLLVHKMLGAVEAAGFDPYLGYLHHIDYGRPSLALDLIEEFRPILVDSLVIRCCNDGRIAFDDFTETPDGDYPVLLSDDGKRRFVAAFEERMRTEATHPDGADGRPGKVSYLRCLALQARCLARAVQGGADYEPFAVR
jgi:CRISPR-associated protein Cas1